MLISLQALALSAVLAGFPQAPGQAPAAPAPPSSIDWPVSLERIQEAVAKPPAIRTDLGRPTFRVEIVEDKPSIEAILGPNYLVGPTPNSGMTHREFLDMVTPQEFRGMGVFTGGEALAVAATSIGLQWALLKAIDKLEDARTDRAKEAARQEVREAMERLAAARKKAGLPEKNP